MPSGFLYSVRAVVDRASFAEGISQVQKLAGASKAVVAGIMGISAAVVGAAAMAGEVATQEIKMANAVGVSSDALASWKISAGLAGVSAGGLVSSLSALESKMQRLKTGAVDANLAKNLGLLGIGYGDFAKMGTEDRMKAVFRKAEGMEDQRLAATLISDVLGQAGREYYDSLKLSGKTLEQQLAEARRLSFVNEGSRKGAALFASEVRGIKSAGESIVQLFGSELARNLLPTARRIKSWLMANREAIVRGVSGIASRIASVFDVISGAVGKLAPYISAVVDKFGGLDKILIRVGVGFAGLKIAGFVSGIRQVVGSIGLLKAGLAGLAGAGLGYVLEDLLAHFTGNESLIFDHILPGLSKIRQKIEEELGVKLDAEGLKQTVKDLFDALAPLKGKLEEALGVKLNLDTIATGIAKIAKAAVDLGKAFGTKWLEAVKTGLDILGDLRKIIDALIGRDWDKLLDNLKKLGGDWWAGIGSNLPIVQAAQGAAGGFSAARERGESVPAAVWGAAKGAAGALYDQARALLGAPATDQAHDAILSPGGRLTKLDPQDWVFAVKNVGNLAAGFAPASVRNNSNTSISAPASYVINQSYTVNGGRGEAVRSQAYRGTAEALRATLGDSSRVRQLMPGTR